MSVCACVYIQLTWRKPLVSACRSKEHAKNTQRTRKEHVQSTNLEEASLFGKRVTSFTRVLHRRRYHLLCVGTRKEHVKNTSRTPTFSAAAIICFVCAYVCIYIHIHRCMYVCMYVYTCVCMCICRCTCI